MNDTRSAGLRLPVQAAVDRTTTNATLADGASVEASQVQAPYWWFRGPLVNTTSPLPGHF
jgi:hypothetical protein